MNLILNVNTLSLYKFSLIVLNGPCYLLPHDRQNEQVVGKMDFATLFIVHLI